MACSGAGAGPEVAKRDGSGTGLIAQPAGDGRQTVREQGDVDRLNSSSEVSRPATSASGQLAEHADRRRGFAGPPVGHDAWRGEQTYAPARA